MELECAPAVSHIDEWRRCLICEGPFELAYIREEIVEGQRVYTDETVAATNKYWEALLKEKPYLFDGESWTMVSAKAKLTEDSRRSLELKMQRSFYRFGLFTHLTDAGLSMNPPSLRSQILGVGSLTFTNDSLLVLGKRTERCGCMPCFWSYIPVGVLDSPCLQGVLAKESLEELSLDPAVDVEDLWCLGVFDCGTEQGNLPNVVFVQRLRLTRDDVLCRYQSAKDRAEHTELIFIEPTAVDDLRPLTSVTRVAVQALLHLPGAQLRHSRRESSASA